MGSECIFFSLINMAFGMVEATIEDLVLTTLFGGGKAVLSHFQR
jgi:hypothetical protein